MKYNQKASPAHIITDMVIARLEQGVSPWVRPWKTAAARRPMRACGTPYSGINCLFLWALAEIHGFSSPFWMTYKQAADLGGQVRRGERSSPAIFYKQYEVEPKPEDPDDDGTRRVMRAYNVFNACQIDGLPEKYLPADPSDNDKPIYADRAKIDAWFATVPLQVRHQGNEAWYCRKSDIIQLPPVEAFDSYPDYAATRWHESIHATGHSNRLNREFGKRFADQAYAFEELVAETGSLMLGAELNLPDSMIENHTAYIKDWLDILKSDATAILAAAAKAEQAVGWLQEHAAIDHELPIAA